MITPELIHLGIEGPIERVKVRISKPYRSTWTPAAAAALRLTRNVPLSTTEYGQLQCRLMTHQGTVYVLLRDISACARRMYYRIYEGRGYGYAKAYAAHISMPNGRKAHAIEWGCALAVMRGDSAYPQKA